jgi:alkylation response protein AidB-like acyl-CoA dehydrogenase
VTPAAHAADLAETVWDGTRGSQAEIEHNAMDFAWSDQQQELLDAVGRFASQQLDYNVIENDRNGVFNHDAWKKCGDFGIQGLPVPAEYGGLGMDPLTTVAALERLGYACKDNGLLFSINAHMWTAIIPVLYNGSEAQKKKYLPGLCNGTLIGGNAMSEPNSGSDAFSLATTAVKKGSKYLLNGSKIFVTNGPVADLLVVFATLDKARGADGICAFLVDKDSPGLNVARKLEKMGVRTSPMAEVFFEDCEVPEENFLGKEGAGSFMFTKSMTWERGCILASAVGSMQRLLETSIRYANERRQFGQSIGKFQRVADKIVDMKLRVENARHMLYHCAWLRGQGKQVFLEAAMAKLHISDCWVKCCEDAIQIHGGYGYMTEYEVERELRDAIGSKLYSGTSEIQRNIIASMLGL